jgi:hypothetical protein
MVDQLRQHQAIGLLPLMLFLLAGTAAAATYWTTDPSTCPISDAAAFPGQSCTPQRICGDDSGTAQCYDTATISPPAAPATSNTNYTLTMPGGYMLNCYGTKDASAPYCDNSTAAWCNFNTTCYTTRGRDTICTAGVWGASTCGSCRTTFIDCDADPVTCEVQVNITNCAVGSNNKMNQSCQCECDPGYLDCDASGAGAGTGCEVRNGASCMAGPLYGAYVGCTCVVNKTYYQTGGFTQYLTQSNESMLWFKDWNPASVLINASNTLNQTWTLNASGCIKFMDGTTQCSAAAQGSTAPQDQNITALWQNASAQEAQITNLLSNASDQQASLTGLWANASNHEGRIAIAEGAVIGLWGNASNQDARIIALEGAGHIAQDNNITLLWGNASGQDIQLQFLLTNASNQDNRIITLEGRPAAVPYWITRNGYTTSNESINGGKVNVTGGLDVNNSINVNGQITFDNTGENMVRAGELWSSQQLLLRSRNGFGIIIDGSGSMYDADEGGVISLGGFGSPAGDAAAGEMTFKTNKTIRMMVNPYGFVIVNGSLNVSSNVRASGDINATGRVCDGAGNCLGAAGTAADVFQNITALQANATALWGNASNQDGRIIALETAGTLAQDNNITQLWSNASVQESHFGVLFSNDTALWSNASDQQANIAGLWSNASVQQAHIAALFANDTALWSNASWQEAHLGVLFANDTALWGNASNQDGRIIALETAGNLPQDNNITQLWSNASDQDGRIIALETRGSLPQDNNITLLWSNASGQNVQLQFLLANASDQDGRIIALETAGSLPQDNNITLLWGNASDQQANIAGLWSNASVQQSQLTFLFANDTALWFNASAQQTLLGVLFANDSALWSNASDQDGRIRALESAGFFNNITNFTGTLTDQKVCIYDAATNRIICNTDQSTYDDSRLVANITMLWGNETALWANASDQQANLAILYANATALWINASVQQSDIAALLSNDTALWANASVQQADFGALFANDSALWANASDQQALLGALFANDSALWANASDQQALLSVLFANDSALWANASDQDGRIRNIEAVPGYWVTAPTNVTASNISVNGGNVNVTGSLTVTGNLRTESSTASGNYSIALGFGNTASGPFSSVTGGDTNTASGQFSVVSGGSLNTAGGLNSVVAGGVSNSAGNSYAVVSGGRLNTATNSYSVVSGGFGNAASGNSAVVAGGISNIANGQYSAVSGGLSNTASSFGAVVAGGDTNTASNIYSAVSGGEQNNAGGSHSAIMGGQINTASGQYSAVPGGRNNTASGDYSIAAGYSVQATAANSLALGRAFVNPLANSFAVGFGDITLNVTDNLVQVSGDVNATGRVCDGAGNCLDTLASGAGVPYWITENGLTASNKSVNNGNVNVTGDLWVTGNVKSGGGADLAENFKVLGPAEAGDVMVISGRQNEAVEQSGSAYAKDVAGVISEKPSNTMNADADGKPLALAGRVRVKVTGEGGPIARGDLLVTSSTPGHAMRCADPARCSGAVLGKALEPFEQEEGKIMAIVALG